MDRQKLSKVVLDQIRERERETTSWSRFQHRFSRSWNRVGASSIWEKGVIAAIAILLVMAVPAAIFAFSSGGGDDAPPAAVVSRRTPVASEFPTTTPSAKGPTPRPIAIGGSRPTSTPTTEPNRRNCDAIEGTPYQSDEERQWYADNCDEEEPTPTAQQGGGNPPPPPAQPPTQPPPVQPTQAPPPDQGLTAGQAAALGAQFLGVSANSCSASRASSYWRVTCGSTRVCVFERPAIIDYC
jgi:hypothetical protein